LPRFTVFTPTFNRAATLDRVWSSLQAQSYRDFEWLVVDDGSTDDTRRLVEGWATEAVFPVRYQYQQNAGKHIALNRAAQAAQGEFFLIADSDDAFEARALARFVEVWDSIPQDLRASFVGVTARCQTQHGEFVGTPLPQAVVDSDNLELQYRYKVSGEKWGFVRTEILRQFPCDESPEMGAFPWGRIAAAGYRTRYVDEVLRTYYVDERADSMSKTVTVKRPMTNVHRNVETLNLAWKYWSQDPAGLFKASFNLARFGTAAGLHYRDLAPKLAAPGARRLLAATWVLAVLKPIKGVQ